MRKLTVEKCQSVIEGFKWMVEESPGMSIRDEYDLQAYQIALPVLEQQGDYFGSLVLKARESAEKAMAKFPQPNYVLLKVAEEAGEVVQAGVHYAEKRMTWEELEGEVVQLMAMLFRLVTEGDQVNGITPPQPQPATTPQIDNDGWIEWRGGECPVPDGTIVEIKMRDGLKLAEEAQIFRWNDATKNQSPGADIIAYRVVENNGREEA